MFKKKPWSDGLFPDFDDSFESRFYCFGGDGGGRGGGSSMMAGRGLYFDVLGSLRRCLSQDESVRRNVYAGCVSIAHRCPWSRPLIVELLTRQLSRVVSRMDRLWGNRGETACTSLPAVTAGRCDMLSIVSLMSRASFPACFSTVAGSCTQMHRSRRTKLAQAGARTASDMEIASSTCGRTTGCRKKAWDRSRMPRSAQRASGERRCRRSGSGFSALAVLNGEGDISMS